MARSRQSWHRLRVPSSPRKLVLLVTAAWCPLLLAVLVVRSALNSGSSASEVRSAGRPTGLPGQQAQLELDAVATVLRQLADSTDSKTRRLAEAARRSLARAAFELGLAADADVWEPAPPSTPARVCPEHYLNATVGYPFFYDGWRTADCPLRRDYGRLLTVLLAVTGPEDAARARRVLAGLNRLWPGVPALVAAADTLGDELRHFRNVTVVPLPATEPTPPLGTLVNRLVRRAGTEYVLLGTELSHLDGDANLERLLREAERQNASAVAGAARLADGRWSHGCFQVGLTNYSLRFRAGYHRSARECLVCDHVAGPFVARAALLRRRPLAARSWLLAEELFLQVRRDGGRPPLVCPDVMFHVRDAPTASAAEPADAWLPLARQLGVLLVQPPGGGVRRFGCWQLRSGCLVVGGRSLSPCCRRQLLRLVHSVMTHCQEAGAICELQEGTLLGALKVGTILPWERDADIAFSSADLGKLERTAESLKKDGFRWVLEKRSFCCHENRTSGGVAMVRFKQWRAELWGQHWMDTEKLRDEDGLPPTRVPFDGRWYPGPRNPGLYVRNRYGRDVYRHAEHWQSTGMTSGWAAYNTESFQPCPDPGDHACLDQYLTDGVLQFSRDA